MERIMVKSLILLLALMCLLAGCLNGCSQLVQLPNAYMFLKSIESETPISESKMDSTGFCSVTKQAIIKESIPDYFGLRACRNQYLAGMSMVTTLCNSVLSDLIQRDVKSNIQEQAFIDGLIDGAVRRKTGGDYHKGIEIIFRREKQRDGLWREFWSQYETIDMAIKPTSQMSVDVITYVSNRYEEAWSYYVNGYCNASWVVNYLQHPPIAPAHYLGVPGLGMEIREHSYCYGWYAACYDYFRNHGNDLQASLYFKEELESFKEIERKFWMFVYYRWHHNAWWQPLFSFMIGMD